MKTTAKAVEKGVLNRLLNSFSESLTPAMARRIAAFRADAETQARVDELATKCNEGALTAGERREYEAYVRAIHVISVLQSKARIVHMRGRKWSIGADC